MPNNNRKVTRGRKMIALPQFKKQDSPFGPISAIVGYSNVKYNPKTVDRDPKLKKPRNATTQLIREENLRVARIKRQEKDPAVMKGLELFNPRTFHLTNPKRRAKKTE